MARESSIVSDLNLHIFGELAVWRFGCSHLSKAVCGSTFPATGLIKCLNKSGAVLESPGGTAANAKKILGKPTLEPLFVDHDVVVFLVVSCGCFLCYIQHIQLHQNLTTR